MADELSYQLGGKDGLADLRDIETILKEALATQPGGLLSGVDWEARATGPMFTKHWGSPVPTNDVHMGAGGEIGARWPNGFGLAAGGHYMANDSMGNPAMWGGVTPSYMMGNPDGFWVDPGVMVGMMKKQDYNDGQISPFALPRLGMGYGPVRVDMGYIPPVGSNKSSVGLLQLGLQKRF